MDDEAIPFADRAAFEAWLDEHHASSDGIWVKFAKKGSGIPSATHKEILPVALAYGWIDGQAKRIDDDWYRQRWTPRRARSIWSKINRATVEGMIERGEMQPAGLAEVERAKADGRWDRAYDSPRTAEVPGDLRAALDASPAAAKLFAELDSTNRYAILHRLQNIKRPETRTRRIEQYVEMLARGETIYPRRAAR
jgi:uncharacterized protein YdeI (YjbR/CyaY-like superfamily)